MYSENPLHKTLKDIDDFYVKKPSLNSNPMSLQKEKCKECDGNGYTAEHDSPDRHGEYGECLNCPVQVPCEKCEGTGLMSLQKESEWESTLEYALPDRLTDDEKQIIRNNVSLIISNREKEIAEEVEKMKDDLDYDGAVWKESVIAIILKH